MCFEETEDERIGIAKIYTDCGCFRFTKSESSAHIHYTARMHAIPILQKMALNEGLCSLFASEKTELIGMLTGFCKENRRLEGDAK